MGYGQGSDEGAPTSIQCRDVGLEAAAGGHRATHRTRARCIPAECELVTTTLVAPRTRLGAMQAGKETHSNS